MWSIYDICLTICVPTPFSESGALLLTGTEKDGGVEVYIKPSELIRLEAGQSSLRSLYFQDLHTMQFKIIFI